MFPSTSWCLWNYTDICVRYSWEFKLAGVYESIIRPKPLYIQNISKWSSYFLVYFHYVMYISHQIRYCTRYVLSFLEISWNYFRSWKVPWEWFFVNQIHSHKNSLFHVWFFLIFKGKKGMGGVFFLLLVSLLL